MPSTITPKGATSRAGASAAAGPLRFLWLSSWTGWVGLRYLKSKKNSRFLSFITSMSILGVGLGVTSMIVVLSVMDGFEAELKKRLMTSDVHVLVTPTSRLPDFDQGFVPRSSVHETELRAQLAHADEIVEFYPVVSTEAIIKVRKQVSGIVLKGVGEERLKRIRSEVRDLTEADPNVSRPAGVFLGQELAYELGVATGETVTLISPTETEGPGSAVPRLKKYRVEGIYESGVPEQELHEAYTTTEGVQAFLRRAGIASQWELTVKNFDRAPEVAADLRQALPGYRVQDWIDLNAHLFQSLRLERASMSVILAFIVVVASFNIVTTLTLMVLEKKKEISILKAMGARDGEVAAIFVAEGLLIGGAGIWGGTVLGFLLCVILHKYPIIQLPDVFYDRSLPVTFAPGYYIGIALSASLIVFAACLYPSRRAAKLEPLEGIRFG